MVEPRRRKAIRLCGYDYSQCGAYFITICVKKRCELFWNPNVGAAFCRTETEEFEQILSDAGRIVEKEINKLSTVYKGVYIDCYVIMPNHVHMIIVLQNSMNVQDDDVQDEVRHSGAPTVSRIINQWKRSVSINMGFSPWQKSFHDHIIRNENEYMLIREYIKKNPSNWEKDCFYPVSAE